MFLPVRNFGKLVGASTVGDMALKLGLQPRPLSVREMIQTYGSPLQPTKILRLLE
ncbi:MAG: hypothetical protein L0Y60_02740 [Beijerinckiaceae bacterium]|nr:hypothetical protein [Beijerinckiaceae bacterium]